MLGLDTNVLVRLLIEDDAAQTRRARKLVDTAIAEEETVLVSLPALLEDGMGSPKSLRSATRNDSGSVPRSVRSAGTSVRGRAAVEEALFQLAG